MLTPELKAYASPDLEYGKLPMRADDCAIRIEAAIGLAGDDRADRFFFTVMTPKSLARQQQAIWGRGLLLLKRFSWPDVERALLSLLQNCRASSWEVLAVLLNRELIWEHDLGGDDEPR